MPKHLQRAIDELMKQLMVLSASVEENLNNSMEALNNRDIELAAAVIERDVEIDREEVEIEEMCLQILALHQPVAVDLRFIISALKINNDLERIGDLAADIAKSVIRITEKQVVVSEFSFEEMFSNVKIMLRKSLDSLVDLDANAATEVLKADDIVDDYYKKDKARAVAIIQKEPENAETVQRYMDISRCLERVADLATNIAEDTIYLTKGEIVRHAHSM